MSECWLEKPDDRAAFRWICTAMRRLINDHKVHTRKAQKGKKQYKEEIEGGSLMFCEKVEWTDAERQFLTLRKVEHHLKESPTVEVNVEKITL